MSEESIYNIIPKDVYHTPKKPLYKSKYPYNIPPTGSTFGTHTTSKPGISNMSGQFNVPLQAHTQYGHSKTFGYVKGDRRPLPQNYIKKHTGIMGNQTLPPVRKFSYDCTYKKPQVPKSNQRPIYGAKSDRNFIIANAIDIILSTSKKTKKQIDWLHKKDYGKNPQYLNQIKANIQRQYDMIQNLHINQTQKQQKKLLNQQQINELKQGLKRKWNQLNKQYQKKTHLKFFDTVGSKRTKQNLEKQMMEIQRDLKKISKMYVFIDQ